MRKITYGLIVLMLLAFASASMAQEKPAAPAPEKPNLLKFSGVIEKVDEAARAVEVKGKKGEKTLSFATDQKTKIMKGKSEMAFGDLKSGMRVSVAYKKEGNTLIAVSIKEVIPKAAKKAKPAEETTK